MSENNALVTMDQALLATLTVMVKPEDVAGVEQGPAVLKINYDEESVHGTGVWVLGQKKDKDGHITEQGAVINSLIILTTRLQHSYYDEKNPKNSFSSMLFEWGGKAPDKAAFDARLTAMGKPDEGRFRVVCFGMAVLPDGKTVECVSYMAGTTYPNFKAHYDAITRQKINGQWCDLPPFVCVTHLLPPDREKNGSRVYFIGKFEKGPFLQRDMIVLCGEKREEVYEYIDKLNANPDLGKQSQPQQQPAAPMAPPQQVYQQPQQPVYQQPQQQVFQQPAYPSPAMPDLEAMKRANVAPTQGSPMGDDVPFDLGGGGDIGDLEAAIRAAL